MTTRKNLAISGELNDSVADDNDNNAHNSVEAPLIASNQEATGVDDFLQQDSILTKTKVAGGRSTNRKSLA